VRATTRSGVAAVLLGGAVCAACSPAPEPTAPQPTPITSAASPTPTVSPTIYTDPQAATKAKIIAAYKGYWTAMTRSVAKPKNLPDAGLREFAQDSVVSEGISTILFYRHRAMEVHGAPQHAIQSITVSGSRASIIACIDSSHWQVVFASSGNLAEAPGQPARVVATATAALTAGSWKLSALMLHRDRKC
jgi:hypothetical protein